MDKTSKYEAVMKLLTLVNKAYPYSKADGATFALYAKALEPLSYEEINAGITKCLRKCKFFPTVAEIFEAAESIKNTAASNGKPDAGEAWREAMENAKRNGDYRPWQYSCPEIAIAVKRFGKMDLLTLKSDAVNTARAQFMKIYNSELEREAERKENKKILDQLGAKSVQSLINATAQKLALGTRR